MTENHVSVDLSLNIRYGFNIPSVSEQVQEKVSAAIENMTGAYSAGCEYPDCRREYGRKLTESLMRLGAQVRIRVCSTF